MILLSKYRSTRPIRPIIEADGTRLEAIRNRSMPPRKRRFSGFLCLQRIGALSFFRRTNEISRNFLGNNREIAVNRLFVKEFLRLACVAPRVNDGEISEPFEKFSRSP